MHAGFSQKAKLPAGRVPCEQRFQIRRADLDDEPLAKPAGFVSGG